MKGVSLIILFLVAPVILVADSSPYGRYILSFGYSYDWDENDWWEGHDVGLGVRLPLAESVDLGFGVGKYTSSFNTVDSSWYTADYSSFSFGMGPDFYHKIKIDDSFIDLVTISSGLGFGIRRSKLEQTGVINAKTDETTMNYSLSLDLGFSFFESLFLGPGMTFYDYIEKDYDESLWLWFEVSFLLSEHFFISMDVETELLGDYYNRIISLGSGFRW